MTRSGTERIIWISVSHKSVCDKIEKIKRFLQLLGLKNILLESNWETMLTSRSKSWNVWPHELDIFLRDKKSWHCFNFLQSSNIHIFWKYRTHISIFWILFIIFIAFVFHPKTSLFLVQVFPKIDHFTPRINCFPFCQMNNVFLRLFPLWIAAHMFGLFLAVSALPERGCITI